MARKSASSVPEVGQEPQASRATGFVIVASKLPHDLELQLCTKRDVPTQGRYGPTVEPRWSKTGEIYLIRGTKRPNGVIPRGYPAAPDMVDGYALTPNIPAWFWEEWLKQNAPTEMVKNRVIMAFNDRDSAVDGAKDMHKLRSGLEPLAMGEGERDERLPRAFSGSVEAVKTADLANV